MSIPNVCYLPHSKRLYCCIYIVFFWFLCERNHAKQGRLLCIKLHGNAFLLNGLDYLEDRSTTMLRIIGNYTYRHRVISQKIWVMRGTKSWSSSLRSLLQFPISNALLTPVCFLILEHPPASFSWSYKNVVPRCRRDMHLLHWCLLVYFDEWIEARLGKREQRKNQAIVFNKNLYESKLAAACRLQRCVTLQRTTAGPSFV